MDTKEMIEVMKAFVDGKKIEFRERGSRTWKPDENPEWDWSCIEYRIAPEPKKRCRWERVPVIRTVVNDYAIVIGTCGGTITLDILPRIPGFGGIDYQSPFDPKVIVRSMVPLMFEPCGVPLTAGYDDGCRPGTPVAAWFWKEEK